MTGHTKSPAKCGHSDFGSGDWTNDQKDPRRRGASHRLTNYDFLGTGIASTVRQDAEE